MLSWKKKKDMGCIISGNCIISHCLDICVGFRSIEYISHALICQHLQLLV